MTPDKAVRKAARIVGAGGLVVISGIHAGWASGSSWPASDRRSLARAVIGREEMPSAGACSAVAAMLLAASVIVAWNPEESGWIRRVRDAGLVCVVGSLLLRGLAGTLGLLPPQRSSEAFARWDRRLYTPLCFVIALLCGYGGRRAT